MVGGRQPAGTLRARLSGDRYQGSRLDAHRNGPRMIYALFMCLILLTFAAMWRGHVLQIPLFLVTLAWVLVHVVRDMTTPLTLSF
jgi:hypothetical protein